MVHNMAPFIGACIESLQWVDGIFVFDDHSTDGSVEVAKRHSPHRAQFPTMVWIVQLFLGRGDRFKKIRGPDEVISSPLSNEQDPRRDVWVFLLFISLRLEVEETGRKANW